jgi:hypothetical protein
MRKWLLIVLVLTVPTSVQAASNVASALLGIAAGAIIGVYAMPYVLPTAMEVAPAIVETVGTATTSVGDAIVTNPSRAGAIIGGILGYWAAP